MRREIGVSTGIFARILEEEELELMVNKLLDVDVDLIEILIARPRLADIRFNVKTLERMKKISVSVHSAFFKEEGFEDADLDEDLLSRTEAFAKHVNAQYVVVHPDLVRDWQKLKSFKIRVHIENLKPDRKWDLHKMKLLLNENPAFYVTLDGDHAEKWGEGQATVWAKEFHNRIHSIQLNLKDRYKSIAENNWIPEKYLLEHRGSFVLEKTPFEMSALSLIVKNAKKILNETRT